MDAEYPNLRSHSLLKLLVVDNRKSLTEKIVGAFPGMNEKMLENLFKKINENFDAKFEKNIQPKELMSLVLAHFQGKMYSSFLHKEFEQCLEHALCTIYFIQAFTRDFVDLDLKKEKKEALEYATIAKIGLQRLLAEDNIEKARLAILFGFCEIKPEHQIYTLISARTNCMKIGNNKMAMHFITKLEAMKMSTKDKQAVFFF